jgi:hypothetical protein
VSRYTNKPVVIKEFFDEDIHRKILSFMSDIVPIMPKDSDPTQFNRTHAHNVPFFKTIHTQLAEYASGIFGEKVKPSYCFLSMYNKGGRCPLHVDRPQCRYTIDYLISADYESPWPICIGTQMSDKERESIQLSWPEKKEARNVIKSVEWSEVLLEPNDAVCYSGTNAWHYRPTASKGKTNLIFFHFVPEAFNGPLD